MKKDFGIKLKSYDDIFNVIENIAENDIKYVDINMFVEFRDHPFKVLENKDMDELFESISENGILNPIIVRPLGNKYEIISGHRRIYCAKKAKFRTVPCIIKNLGYDDAVLIMVDSNIQRKNILPSEKAFSYKMKLNALKRQGKRTDLTSRQLDDKLKDDLTSRQLGDKSANLVGKDYNDSARTVQRYVRITELIPFLIDAIDQKKIAFGAGVELSYISKDEQEIIKNIVNDYDVYPSLSQAKEIRTLSGNLTHSNAKMILLENEARGNNYIKINLDDVKELFPKEYSTADIKNEILNILRNNRR